MKTIEQVSVFVAECFRAHSSQDTGFDLARSLLMSQSADFFCRSSLRHVESMLRLVQCVHAAFHPAAFITDRSIIEEYERLE